MAHRTVRIRPYRKTDRRAVLDIAAIAFEGVSMEQGIERLCGRIRGRDWRWRKRGEVAAELRRPPPGCLVAEVAGAVVGFVTLREDRTTGIGRIPNLAVLPAYRGRGLGRRLLAEALRRLRAVGMTVARIETLTHNRVGRRFYPAMGFREIGRQIHYAMPLRPARRRAR